MLFEQVEDSAVSALGYRNPLPAEACRIRILATVPTHLPVNTVTEINCVVDNRGGAALVSAPPNPVHVSYKWILNEDKSRNLDVESLRTRLPRTVSSGEKVKCVVKIKTPVTNGSYTLRLTLVQELVAWFDEIDESNQYSAIVSVVKSLSSSTNGIVENSMILPRTNYISARGFLSDHITVKLQLDSPEYLRAIKRANSDGPLAEDWSLNRLLPPPTLIRRALAAVHCLDEDCVAIDDMTSTVDGLCVRRIRLLDLNLALIAEARLFYVMGTCAACGSPTLSDPWDVQMMFEVSSLETIVKTARASLNHHFKCAWRFARKVG